MTYNEYVECVTPTLSNVSFSLKESYIKQSWENNMVIPYMKLVNNEYVVFDAIPIQYISVKKFKQYWKSWQLFLKRTNVLGFQVYSLYDNLYKKYCTRKSKQKLKLLKQFKNGNI